MKINFIFQVINKAERIREKSIRQYFKLSFLLFA